MILKNDLIDINLCFAQSSPCSNNGICIPGSGGGFSCACTPQYTGAFCDTLIEPTSRYFVIL